jgi:hypothetical protein
MFAGLGIMFPPMWVHPEVIFPWFNRKDNRRKYTEGNPRVPIFIFHA